MQWGWHLILDCASCNDNIKKANVIASFVKDLVIQIDMKAFGEPIIEHFATHDPSKGGYSLVQLIETSAITAHFVDLNGDMYLDVFSCKPFDIETVQDVIKFWFDPKSMAVHFITRQAPKV